MDVLAWMAQAVVFLLFATPFITGALLVIDTFYRLTRWDDLGGVAAVFMVSLMLATAGAFFMLDQLS